MKPLYRPSKLTQLILFLAAAALAVTLAVLPRMTVPASDALDYLGYARSLVLSGQYAATPSGPGIDRAPGREPLYSALIATLAELVPPLGEAVRGCTPPREDCAGGFRALLVLNALLLAGTAVIAARIASGLGAGTAGGLMAWGYVVLNLHMQKDLRFVLSDFLGVFLQALLSWCVLAALGKPRSVARWACVGVALGLLCLCKAVYIGFGVMILLGASVWALWARRRDAWLPILMVAVPLCALPGGWTARNLLWFGVPNDGRAAIALSTREVFDHMTPAEHGAAWLWWTRGFGAGLAQRGLPPEAWHRHEWYVADGFYEQGQVARHEARVALAIQGEGLGFAQAQQRAGRMVAAEILADWPDYLLTLPVMFYRGLWFDEFILIGFPMLVIGLWWGIRRQRWDLLLVLSPSLWSLCVYPAISLNLPRYQYPTLTGFAVITGLTLERFWRARRRPG